MSPETEPIRARAVTGRRKARAAGHACAGLPPAGHQPASCRVALHREQGPRDNLEDAAGWLMMCLGDQSFTGLVVCDGVGGELYGEVCAELGLQEVCALLAVAFAQGRLGDGCSASAEMVGRMLLEIVAQVNHAVVQRALDDPALRGMASTIVFAVQIGATLHVCAAGDSRCYLARGNRLEQITRDHRLHAEQRGPKGSRRQSAADLLSAHTITQYLGNTKNFSADYASRELRDGDLILLCSDGLPDVLTDEEIARHVAAWRAGDCSLDDLPCRLAHDALDAGASDNVTVLCCAYQDPSTATMDSEAPTRTVAYQSALAAPLAHCSKEIINVQTHEN